MVEHRIKEAAPVQLANKSRRFKRDWYKEDKSLKEIHATHQFVCKKDYLELLPKELPETFTIKEASNLLKGRNVPRMLWVLRKMGLVEQVGKQGRSLLLKKKDTTD